MLQKGPEVDFATDGRIYFQDESSGPPKWIILSVKAGNTGSGHVDHDDDRRSNRDAPLELHERTAVRNARTTSECRQDANAP